jgi:hypothetical protein
MSAYIAELNAAVERNQAQRARQRAERECAASQAARERLTPLQDRLARLLGTIPIETQREGLSLSASQAAAAGAATVIPAN